MKKTLKSCFERRPLDKKTNFISLIFLVESFVVHAPNLSFLSGLIKKLAMKTTLKMAFGIRASKFCKIILRGQF